MSRATHTISIAIGSLTWMAENLITLRYNDHTVIDQITNDGLWQGPTGVPGLTKPIVLRMAPSMVNFRITLTDLLVGESEAGGKLKEAGLAHWISPNVGATNESGSTGLLGGFRKSNGNFYAIGSYGSWWSNTVYQTIFAWYRNFYAINADVLRATAQHNTGRAVRCAK